MIKNTLKLFTKDCKKVWKKYGEPNYEKLWVPKIEDWQLKSASNPEKSSKGGVLYHISLDNFDEDGDSFVYLKLGSINLVGTEDGKVWDTKDARNERMWVQIKTPEQLVKRMKTALLKISDQEDSW